MAFNVDQFGLSVVAPEDFAHRALGCRALSYPHPVQAAMNIEEVILNVRPSYDPIKESKTKIEKIRNESCIPFMVICVIWSLVYRVKESKEQS